MMHAELRREALAPPLRASFINASRPPAAYVAAARSNSAKVAGAA